MFSGDNPGFDVVVGNPPWKKVKVEDLTFFGRHAPGLRGIVDSREKRRQLQSMKDANPSLVREFKELKDKLATQKLYFKQQTGGYKFQRKADTDTFRLFCERYMSVWNQEAYVGIVVPIGVLIGDGSEWLREALLTTCTVVVINTVVNKRKWAFPEVHGQYLIALVAAKNQTPTFPLEITTSSGPSESEADFRVSTRASDTIISGSRLADGYQLPRFRRRDGLRIFDKMWSDSRFFEEIRIDFPKKNDSDHAPATRLSLGTEVHESRERDQFALDDGVPVWKGRSFADYDPHGYAPAGHALLDDIGTYLNAKRRRSMDLRSLYSDQELDEIQTLPMFDFRIAFRDVTNSLDYDTLRACLIPPVVLLGHSASYVACRWPALEKASLLGIMNSIALDWQARRYVDKHMSLYLVKILRVPDTAPDTWKRIGELAARLSCVDDRFADFAIEAGVECGPQPSNVRDDQRAEIDALVAHAYGLTKDETAFLFEDYPAGAYTAEFKELVMAKYDAV